MRTSKTILAGVSVALLLATGVVTAGGHALKTMAEITMNLNHYPSDAEKAELKAIIDSDDSSEEEAAIAMALSNMQHSVTEKDAERLADIVDDDAADASARKLAGILLSINHRPSDDDKKALAALAAD